MVRAACHVARKSTVLHDMLGGFHRTAHQAHGALDHVRRPRSEANPPLLAGVQVTVQEALHVGRVVREVKHLPLDGVRRSHVEGAVWRVGRQAVEQPDVPVAGEACFGVNAVGVERMVPQRERRRFPTHVGLWRPSLMNARPCFRARRRRCTAPAWSGKSRAEAWASGPCAPFA